jgi:hypothetical protein
MIIARLTLNRMRDAVRDLSCDAAYQALLTAHSTRDLVTNIRALDHPQTVCALAAAEKLVRIARARRKLPQVRHGIFRRHRRAM